MKGLNRDSALKYIQNNDLEKDEIKNILLKTEIFPNSKSWYSFVDRLLLFIGAVAVALSVIFFIAYNWDNFGNFAKFALVELLLVASIGAYLYLDSDYIASKATLIVASLLLGALLALIGQVYQSGADSYELFLTWAILMLPWVIVGRFAPLWIFWIAVVNVAIYLYFDIRHSFWFFGYKNSTLWGLFLFNTLALALWELFRDKFSYLNKSLAIDIVAFMSASTITLIAIESILDKRASAFVAIFVWLLWLGAIYFRFKVTKINLFILALWAFSISAVVVTFFIRVISWRHLEFFAILFIGVLIIGLGAFFANWLKSIQQEAKDAK